MDWIIEKNELDHKNWIFCPPLHTSLCVFHPLTPISASFTLSHQTTRIVPNFVSHSHHDEGSLFPPATNSFTNIGTNRNEGRASHEPPVERPLMQCDDHQCGVRRQRNRERRPPSPSFLISRSSKP